MSDKQTEPVDPLGDASWWRAQYENLLASIQPASPVAPAPLALSPLTAAAFEKVEQLTTAYPFFVEKAQQFLAYNEGEDSQEMLFQDLALLLSKAYEAGKYRQAEGGRR